MSKETRVSARVDSTSVDEAERIFRRVGISTPEAIRIFFRQVALHRGLPFAVAMPPPFELDDSSDASIATGIPEYSILKEVAL